MKLPLSVLLATALLCIPSFFPAQGPGDKKSNASSLFRCAVAKASETAFKTNSGAALTPADLKFLAEDPDAPEVIFTPDISPEAIVKIYQALGWMPSGKVAVKISTGEPPNSNYLSPDLIVPLVRHVGGTIVECNTAYGGPRAQAASHYRVAEEHGFTAIAPVKILDEDGSFTLKVKSGGVLKESYVGAAFPSFDSYLVLSHFKGHAMAGFGGAVKNISIGLASAEGKSLIHSGGKELPSIRSGEQNAFLEAMGDAGKAVSDYLGGGQRIAYINVLNRISIDCDCNGNPQEPDLHDIGILASKDPVALDQASLDFVYAANAEESGSLTQRINARSGIHTLEHAEAIGLGQRHYRLVLSES